MLNVTELTASTSTMECDTCVTDDVELEAEKFHRLLELSLFADSGEY